MFAINAAEQYGVANTADYASRQLYVTVTQPGV